MRTRTLIWVMVLLAVCSCSKTDDQNASIADRSTLPLSTKGEQTINPKSLDMVYFVSPEDIRAYTHFRKLLAKKDNVDLSVESIVPLGPQEDVTLCYLINYNDGWEVISADKRTPVVLAAQESGTLNLEECPENEGLAAQLSWIGYLAAEVLSVRSNPEYKPNDPEAINGVTSSQDFWCAITTPGELFENRDGGGNPPGLEGYWELVSITEETLEYDQVYLTTPAWSQSSPYNTYAPYRTDYPSLHAPAGCVAVAGAEMLYFLYNHLSSNIPIPSAAYVSGNINSYTISFDTPSTANWGPVLNGNTDAIAVLLAYIGYCLPNQWGNTGTGSSLTNLKNNVYSNFGIASTLADYTASSAKYALTSSGRPIIMSAYGNVTYFLGIPIYNDGHAFLIDKYKRVRKRYTYYYEWVYGYEGEIINFAPEYTEVYYGTPYLDDTVGMNWGWGGYGNSSWYSLSGSWSIDEYSFDYDRDMLCDFAFVN